MGWASAGDIFDRVATALLDEDASDKLVRGVLWPLIEALRNEDWDTWDESRTRFSDHRVIAELFARIGHEMDGNSVYGEIDYHDGHWTLRCSYHGNIAGRRESPTSGAEDHDALVRFWVEHDKDQHGGDGAIDPSWLVEPEAVSSV